MNYAIRINNRYFKEFVYAKEISDRYAGNTAIGYRVDGDDIVDIITTDLPERTEVINSVAGTIRMLLSIEKLEGKIIEVIPLGS